MSFSASAADERVLGVELTDDALSVSLRDGRVITVPLAWYPRLLNATPMQRKNWKVAGGGYGIHWPDLDEDLSTEGLLRGAPAPILSPPDRRTGRKETRIVKMEESERQQILKTISQLNGDKLTALARKVKEYSHQGSRPSTKPSIRRHD
jgi:hypothetical protein